MSTTDAVAFRDGVHAARPAAGGPQPNARLTGTCRTCRTVTPWTSITGHVPLIHRAA